jgi:hypothetical protein
MLPAAAAQRRVGAASGRALSCAHHAPTARPGYDSKRDRWNGYEADEYGKVVSRYEAVEALRQELKLKEQVEALYAQVRRATRAAVRMWRCLCVCVFV